MAPPRSPCPDANVSTCFVVPAPAGSIADLRRIAPDLAPSIAKLTVPAYVLDRNGFVRWLNQAAVDHFGDLRGKRLTQIVEPEYADLARREFAAKILGSSESTEATIDVRTAAGESVRVEISSTQLLDKGVIVGVFGLADPAERPRPPDDDRPVHLTPRQLDVLRHLAAGHSTERIAHALGISVDTVRNHVRGLLLGLDAHSRLEAVMRAHELGLV
jgi:DNA-binding CsgD family transcriptional regulator